MSTYIFYTVSRLTTNLKIQWLDTD